MKIVCIVVGVLALVLAGSPLERWLRSDSLTATAVIDGLHRCGISSNRISWAISPNKTLVLRRASDLMPTLPIQQAACFMHWTDKRRIKVDFIS